METADSGFDTRVLYRKLAMDTDLDGVDLRVFLYLYSQLDFRTYIPVRQVEIAQKLGRRKQHISRAMAKLKAKGIIFEATPKVERSSAWRLNPNYAK